MGEKEGSEYCVIKYDDDNGEEKSIIISSSWFTKAYKNGVKHLRIPKNGSEYDAILKAHRKPKAKDSILIKAYDLLQTFDLYETAKKFFDRMIRDEKEPDSATSSEDSMRVDYNMLMKSSNEPGPSWKSIKQELVSKSVKVDKNSQMSSKQLRSNGDDQIEIASTKKINYLGLKEFASKDKEIVKVDDIKILQENILTIHRQFEKKMDAKIHQILDNMANFTSKVFEEVKNINGNEIQQSSDGFVFPLCTWDDFTAFCLKLQGDKIYQNKKIKDFSSYCKVGSNFDSKSLTKTLRQFFNVITTAEVRLQGNFAGRKGNGEKTNKIPGPFMPFIKESFCINSNISLTLIEESAKKAWNQTFDTVQKTKKRELETVTT